MKNIERIIESQYPPRQTNVAWKDVNENTLKFYVDGEWRALKDEDFRQKQADWNQADNTKEDFIKNKPTIPAEQIQADWDQSDDTKADYIKNKPIIPSVNFCWTTKRKLALEGEGFSSWDEAEEEIGLNEELFNAMLNNPFIVKTNSSIDDTLIIIPLVSVTESIVSPFPPGSEPTQKEVYIKFSDSVEDDRKSISLVFTFSLSTGELDSIWININNM